MHGYKWTINCTRTRRHAVTSGRAVQVCAEITRFIVRVRLKIIRNARIKNVGQSESCTVDKVPIIFKRTVQIEIQGRPLCTKSERNDTAQHILVALFLQNAHVKLFHNQESLL